MGIIQKELSILESPEDGLPNNSRRSRVLVLKAGTHILDQLFSICSIPELQAIVLKQTPSHTPKTYLIRIGFMTSSSNTDSRLCVGDFAASLSNVHQLDPHCYKSPA